MKKMIVLSLFLFLLLPTAFADNCLRSLNQSVEQLEQNQNESVDSPELYLDLIEALDNFVECVDEQD